MTALTIDIDDRLIAALRDTAARRRMTVDAVVGECVALLADESLPDETDLADAHASFRELATRASLSFEPGRSWNREESHERSVLR